MATTVERRSVCPLDCPDTCSLTVTVQDETIVAIRGSHANPYTDGVLCAKVPAMYPAFVHGERRIRTPLTRVGERAASRASSRSRGTRRSTRSTRASPRSSPPTARRRSCR